MWALQNYRVGKIHNFANFLNVIIENFSIFFRKLWKGQIFLEYYKKNMTLSAS